MADNTITLVGNVTDDAELRFTPRGQAVANFTVAVNRRWKDQDGQWQDKLDGFFKCNVWGAMAENVAESLTKGTRILVTGRLQQRSWEDNDGNKRSAVEIQVDEVGPSLKWSTAQVTKTQRTGTQGGGGGGGDWGNSGAGSQGGGPSSGSAGPGDPASVGAPGAMDEGGF
ncbi:MAG: single-stranded DNA-binding protein [Actinomycetota bacterium]|nr:single-stranded DNA-binding protein [Actinomycetota bacterium]